MAPFQALYGRPPLSIPTYQMGASSVNEVDQSMITRDAVLKLGAYRQQSVYRRTIQNLAIHFYGSYYIEARIGNVAYRLKLLEGSKIHPVFHVSMLKRKVDTRWVKKGSKFVEESLVQWSGLPKEDATWENTEELHEKFISMNLEDKVPQKEGSNGKPTRRSTRVPITNRRYLK
ncbi:transposon Tf2-12 polyprotein [Tanacetum coccineum]